MAKFNTFKFNTRKFNASAPSFYKELDKMTGTKPRYKIEFIDVSGVATDISQYYESGAQVERIKERAPDEIQSGDFDIVLINSDDTFSEFVSGSFLNGQTRYHGAKIRVWAGFELSDGRTEYQIQQVGYIDELVAMNDSRVTFRCRDIIRRILDEKLNVRTADEIPVAGASNFGDGTCSSIATKPFKTVNESWTLTCTTAGGDGVAEFSVVGSVTGSAGTATAGTEFSTGTGSGGIRFTIEAGSAEFITGDSFTFDTKQSPEWTSENPAKIIWSVLTGTNFDTGAAEAWASRVLDMDSTRSNANTDIDYTSFVTLAAQFSASDDLTGYAAHEEGITDFIEGLLLIFLGSLYTIGDGRIRIKSYLPTFGAGARSYADSKKIMTCGYRRAVSEIINAGVVRYKSTDTWEFSDDDIVYDGVYSLIDSASSTNYGTLLFNGEAYEMKWYSPSGIHAQDFVNRVIQKYKDPPLVVEFSTGSDGLIAQIGDRIVITDDKFGFSDLACEISQVTKQFDTTPMTISITARRDGDVDLQYGYLGSRVDEGDGESPQASTYGAASDSDKEFCYLTDNYRIY